MVYPNLYYGFKIIGSTVLRKLCGKHNVRSIHFVYRNLNLRFVEVTEFLNKATSTVNKLSDICDRWVSIICQTLDKVEETSTHT